MWKYALRRYLYDNRAAYLAVLFIFITGLSCGLFTGARLYVDSLPYMSFDSYGMLLLKNLLPLFIICVSGLFFLGNILITVTLAYYSYSFGLVICAHFMFSFWRGMLFLLLYALPICSVYLICIIVGASMAYRCNFSRLSIKMKGLGRKMNNYELKKYIGFFAIIVGIIMLAGVADVYVFSGVCQWALG